VDFHSGDEVLLRESRAEEQHEQAQQDNDAAGKTIRWRHGRIRTAQDRTLSLRLSPPRLASRRGNNREQPILDRAYLP